MKLDAKNDPAIREFENWVKDELHGTRTEQPSTTQASETVTSDDDDYDIEQSRIEFQKELIAAMTRAGAKEVDLPAPRAGERDVITLLDEARYAEDVNDRVRAAAQIIRQHATLVEQRDRLLAALKSTAHNAADGSGLCWCAADDRVFGHQRKCTSIRRVLNEVKSTITTIEQGGKNAGEEELR